MSRKLIVVLVLVALVVFGVAGFATTQDEPVRVGVLTDLSGWLSIYGVEQSNGFALGMLYEAGIDPAEYESIDAALAELTVAGRPVEIITKDYGSENPASDADNASALSRELIESDLVDVIFGTPNSGAAIAVQEMIKPEENNILFFAGPAASPSLTGDNFNVNTFRVCRNALQDAQTLASIGDVFGQTYVVMAVDTDFGRGTAAGFVFAFEAQGYSFVQDTILVPSDTVDFTPYLQQVLDSGADAVIQVWAGAGGVTLAQQTVELGVLEQMTLATGTNSNDIIMAAPPPIDTVAYIVYNHTLPQTAVNDWLSEKHSAVFGEEPDLFTECSFATGQALYQALEATGGDPFPEAMIPALEGLAFEGPKGTYTIRPSDHQALAAQYVIQFKGIDIEKGEPIYDLVGEVSPEDAAPPCLLTGEFQDRCAAE
jgi:branched-chain amino acid transport system substrate-binding protein